MTVSVAYYYPREIPTNSTRASDIRVEQMLKSFRELGYRVHLIAGSPRERRQRIKEFKREVAGGLKVEFIYGESTNAPIALAEKRIWPANFIADYRFFSWLKGTGIPSGIFYRDIHWRFAMFQQLLPWPLSYLVKPLYYLDWYVYNRYWDYLFLPSEAMNAHLPKPRTPGSFAALPPGYDQSQKAAGPQLRETSDKLRLLYVGGIEPAVYDLSTLFQVIREHENVSLTLCCREDEWHRHRMMYETQLCNRVNVAHPGREQIAEFYHRSDLFLMLMPESEYLEFAVPVKFFEAIGYALPMVSMNQPQVDRLIEEQQLGWVISRPDELSGLIDRLSKDRSALENIHENLLSYRRGCTWIERARSAANCLRPSRT